MRTGQRRWRTLFAGCATVAVMAVVAGCGGDDGGSASSGGGTAESFKVGVATSETGRLAIFDQPFLQGLKLQVEQINAAGGIGGKTPIELVVQDAKSDPSNGAVVAQDVIAKGVKFLVTTCDADASVPASQLAQKAGIPAISACGSGESLFHGIGDMQFINVVGIVVEGRAMAEFAHKKGFKRAYVLTSHDIEYTDSMMKAATARFQELGGEIVGTSEFKLDQPRYTTQATEIAKANPDVVLTSIFLPMSVTFLKNLRAAGYDGPIVGNDGQEGSETFSAGDAVKDLYVFAPAYRSDDEAGQGLAKFYASFAEKYGKEPGTAIAALGGDVGCLIDHAVKTAGSTDPKAVRDALADAVDVVCPTGPISYKGSAPLPKKYSVFLKANAAEQKFEFVERFFSEPATE